MLELFQAGPPVSMAGDAAPAAAAENVVPSYKPTTTALALSKQNRVMTSGALVGDRTFSTAPAPNDPVRVEADVHGVDTAVRLRVAAAHTADASNPGNPIVIFDLPMAAAIMTCEISLARMR